MNSATIKDLTKYIKPGNGWKVGAIVCVVLAVIYMAVLPVLTVTCLVIAALCIWRYVAAQKKMEAQLESSGALERVLADFASAKSYFKDSLRVGNYYLYGKNHGRMVPYGDIKQVYQHVQRTYFVESARNLTYVGPDGKARALCKLPLRDKGKEELLQVLAVMLSKNPNIKVGYQ